MLEDISYKILEDREKRSNLIKSFLESYTVVSLKSNFPSSDKNNYLAWVIVSIFEKVYEGFSGQFAKYKDKELIDSFDGRYILYTFDNSVDASKLKEFAMILEDNHELGRYIDIDVYDYKTKSVLTRGVNKQRKCILCDSDASVCAREKRHDVEEIIDKIEFDVRRYLDTEVKKLINYSCALELNLKYKFGLVSPYHRHKDMDIDLMTRAYKVLIYPFLEMFSLGFELDDLEELNKHLHVEGKRAEYLMFKETNGVNCYKGLIFLLGMFLGGLGYSIKHKMDLKKCLLELNSNILEEYKDDSLDTFGAIAYREYGFLGARGEAHNGFYNVFKNVSLLNDYTDTELYRLLISLVKDVDDTVLLKRSGSLDLYNYYKNMISNVDYNDIDDIQIKTLECERANISIGGVADMFVITVFFGLFKKQISIEGVL